MAPRAMALGKRSPSGRRMEAPHSASMAVSSGMPDVDLARLSNAPRLERVVDLSPCMAMMPPTPKFSTHWATSSKLPLSPGRE